MDFHVQAHGQEASTEGRELSTSPQCAWIQHSTEMQMWKDYVVRLSAAYCHDRQVLAQFQHQWQQACAAQMQLKAELENEQLAHRKTKEQLDEERLDHGTVLEDLSWQRHRLRECEQDTNAVCDALRRCHQIAETSLRAFASVKPAAKNGEAVSSPEDADELRLILLEENSALQLRNKELESLVASKDKDIAEMGAQIDNCTRKANDSNARRRRGGRNRGGKKKQRT